MKRTDLTGYGFTGKDGIKYIVLSGYEESNAVYREYSDKNALLWFCCDAKKCNGGLVCSYPVCYCVPQKEFFVTIDSLTYEKKSNSETIVKELKRTYYKIPNIFLNLVEEMYLKEGNTNGNARW